MSWPKLSESLSEPILFKCQLCLADTVARWREHDDNDQPTETVIILCNKCSDKIIEPHPRLYSRMNVFEPSPGSMPICGDCKLRDGVKCKSPKLLSNGGAGLKLTYPNPGVAFVDGRDKSGKRFGRREIIYHGPVTACDGKEV